MNEYTLSEAIAMLEKDSTLEFETTYAGIIKLSVDNNGSLKFATVGIDIRHYLDNSTFRFSLDRKWKLIEKHVSWQEAIQALIDGNDIKCVMPCSTHVYLKYYTDLVLNKEYLKSGKWYIVPTE